VILTSLAHISRILTGFFLIKIISTELGPDGFGRLGHYMSMIAILTVLSGGGIFNGVIKYVSEFRSKPIKLMRFISSAASYSLFVGLLIFGIGVVFSKYISIILFGTEDFSWTIILLSIVQLLLGFSMLVNGIANGLKATYVFVSIQIFGNVLSIPAVYILTSLYGLKGAAVGLAFSLASFTLPAYYYYKTSHLKKLVKISFVTNRHFYNLFGYSAMALMSAITFPIVEILIRQMIVYHLDYTSAGIWQAGIKLSSAYVGFFTMFLALYFVPIISEQENKKIISHQIFLYIFVLSLVFIMGASVFYIFREHVVFILFSEKFNILNQIIYYQLIGDYFKIVAYVIGYVAVAKAATKLYIFAEIFQSVLFFVLSRILFSMNQDIVSIMQAYVCTYFLYFVVCLISLYIYLMKKNTRPIGAVDGEILC